jgi:hypothetical protein
MTTTTDHEIHFREGSLTVSDNAAGAHEPLRA